MTQKTIRELQIVVKKLRKALAEAKLKADKEARTCTFAERYMARQHQRIEEISKNCVLITENDELRRERLVKFLKEGVY